MARMIILYTHISRTV